MPASSPETSSHQFPIAEDVSLAHMETGEDAHQLYVFDTPELRERYVVRGMAFTESSALEAVPLGEQYAIYNTELTALADAGINVPQTYSAPPEDIDSIVPMSPVDRNYQDVMVVTERVEPAEIASADEALIRQQARRYVDGLANYLESSYDPSRNQSPYYLSDVFKPTEAMFGRTPDGVVPDFFMVDTGATMSRTDSEYSTYDSNRTAILATAVRLSELTGDPTVREHARERLGMDETQTDQALRSYYYDTGDPDFEDYA